MDGQFFQVGVGAVVLDVVDPHKPRILRIDHAQLAPPLAQRGVAEGHVIGHRTQLAIPRQGKCPPFAGHDVASHQQGTIILAVGLLEQLALATAARALVGDDHLHAIGGDYLHG
jgi:hypothetical protein